MNKQNAQRRRSDKALPFFANNFVIEEFNQRARMIENHIATHLFLDPRVTEELYRELTEIEFAKEKLEG